MLKDKLPIGIQDFEKIRVHGLTYVDKTELIYHLACRYDPFFLSRPRRFGKSLMVSTLQALFSGKRDLFQGLWIGDSAWEWNVHPIIRLDMSSINNRTTEIFEQDLIRKLNEIAADHHIALMGTSAANHLESLIRQLAQKAQVVVLIDEYDKPIIDNIDHLDIAAGNRKILQEFYGILKAQDGNLRFTFLTGVTKFSKVSVFSGLNNLNDLTLSNEYSALLGYTQSELEKYFPEEIQAVAVTNALTIEQCHQKIKEWYDGYKFSKHGELIYNPFSTLKLLDSKDFVAHWFETGTPTFLIDLIKKRHFDLSNLEQINVSLQSFSSFDIEELPTLPLLYQTGYLTIKAVLPHLNAYCLGFPNREVSQAFSESLLTTFASSRAESSKLLLELAANLYAPTWDYAQFFEIMQNVFALIPYDLYVKQEKHFHSLFHLIIKLAGFQINAEVHTQQGRADAVLETKDKIMIFEFKLNATAQVALDQIHDRKYGQFYLEKKLPIYLIGVNFNGQKRAIDEWQVELIC